MAIIKDTYWNYNTKPVNENFPGAIPGSSIPVVELSGKAATPEEIARHAAGHAAGIHEPTLLAGYDLMEGEIAATLLSGRAFHGRNFIVTPLLGGVVKPGGDTSGVKKLFSCTVTKPFAAELKNVTLTLRQQKDFEDFAKIIGVEDVLTHKTDNTITVGDDIFITGDKIRILGKEQPTPGVIEPGIGVYFVPATGAAIHAPRINQNEPSFVNVRVPATLAKNQPYTLRIVTRFTGGDLLLANPRTIEYHHKLKTNP